MTSDTITFDQFDTALLLFHSEHQKQIPRKYRFPDVAMESDDYAGLMNEIVDKILSFTKDMRDIETVNHTIKENGSLKEAIATLCFVSEFSENSGYLTQPRDILCNIINILPSPRTGRRLYSCRLDLDIITPLVIEQIREHFSNFSCLDSTVEVDANPAHDFYDNIRVDPKQTDLVEELDDLETVSIPIKDFFDRPEPNASIFQHALLEIDELIGQGLDHDHLLSALSENIFFQDAYNVLHKETYGFQVEEAEKLFLISHTLSLPEDIFEDPKSDRCLTRYRKKVDTLIDKFKSIEADKEFQDNVQNVSTGDPYPDYNFCYNLIESLGENTEPLIVITDFLQNEAIVGDHENRLRKDQTILEFTASALRHITEYDTDMLKEEHISYKTLIDNVYLAYWFLVDRELPNYFIGASKFVLPALKDCLFKIGIPNKKLEALDVVIEHFQDYSQNSPKPE